jgi:hypothetical protein
VVAPTPELLLLELAATDDWAEIELSELNDSKDESVAALLLDVWAPEDVPIPKLLLAAAEGWIENAAALLLDGWEAEDTPEISILELTPEKANVLNILELAVTPEAEENVEVAAAEELAIFELDSTWDVEPKLGKALTKFALVMLELTPEEAITLDNSEVVKLAGLEYIDVAAAEELATLELDSSWEDEPEPSGELMAFELVKLALTPKEAIVLDTAELIRALDMGFVDMAAPEKLTAFELSKPELTLNETIVLDTWELIKLPDVGYFDVVALKELATLELNDNWDDKPKLEAITLVRNKDERWLGPAAVGIGRVEGIALELDTTPAIDPVVDNADEGDWVKLAACELDIAEDTAPELDTTPDVESADEGDIIELAACELSIDEDIKLELLDANFVELGEDGDAIVEPATTKLDINDDIMLELPEAISVESSEDEDAIKELVTIELGINEDSVAELATPKVDIDEEIKLELLEVICVEPIGDENGIMELATPEIDIDADGTMELAIPKLDIYEDIKLGLLDTVSVALNRDGDAIVELAACERDRYEGDEDNDPKPEPKAISVEIDWDETAIVELATCEIDRDEDVKL